MAAGTDYLLRAMAMKKAMAAAALAAGLALAVGDTALGAAGGSSVDVRSGRGGNGGNGASAGRAGDTFIRRGGGAGGGGGFLTNNGVRGNSKRQSGIHAHPRKPDPQPTHGFDF